VDLGLVVGNGVAVEGEANCGILLQDSTWGLQKRKNCLGDAQLSSNVLAASAAISSNILDRAGILPCCKSSFSCSVELGKPCAFHLSDHQGAYFIPNLSLQNSPIVLPFPTFFEHTASKE